MSEAASETTPEILVNDEQLDPTAAGEEGISPVTQHDESTENRDATEKETQAKVQSVFQQVRTQIRSQVGIKVSKSSILELVQKIRDREIEIVQENSRPDGTDAHVEEGKEAEVLKDECRDDLDLRLEMLCKTFEEKLEVTKKDVKIETDAQISLVRKEMQTYTDQALKDLQSKMETWRCHSLQHLHSKPQQTTTSAEKKQKPSATPSLALRRGKVLTRTMTTIIPKTSAPIITGPRAKSEETLSSTKGQSSQVLLRDPVRFLRENKTNQSRNPLPPAHPPPHQRKKPVQAKPKTPN